MTSASAPARAAKSPLFISSQLGCLPCMRVRTRCQRPDSFLPNISNSRWPFFSPLVKSPTGSQVPLSQMSTCPPPYWPFGNIAFEFRVRDRVVFDFDGEALVGRIERRSLGHGPAAQRAFPFEAKVPVQAPRGVLLHHEDELLAASGFRLVRRLGGFLEVALGDVALEARLVRDAPRPPCIRRGALRADWRCGDAPRCVCACCARAAPFAGAAAFLREALLQQRHEVDDLAAARRARSVASSSGSVSVCVWPAFTFCSMRFMRSSR